MTRLLLMAASAAATLALSACSDTGSATAPSASLASVQAPAMRTGSPADEAACMNAVRQQTGNTVVVTSSEFSQANTLVMIGVGPQQAPWRCLVSGGVVQEVMSMADEGSL